MPFAIKNHKFSHLLFYHFRLQNAKLRFAHPSQLRWAPPVYGVTGDYGFANLQPECYSASLIGIQRSRNVLFGEFDVDDLDVADGDVTGAGLD